MHHNLILWPLLAQVALTIGVFLWLNAVKGRALKNGEVDLARRALHDDAWPDYVVQVSNNIRNQFQTPVLFYALVFVLWAIPAVDVYALVLAWGYVTTRVAHLHVHLGSNYVPTRKTIFGVGFALLAGMLALCVRGLA